MDTQQRGFAHRRPTKAHKGPQKAHVGLVGLLRAFCGPSVGIVGKVWAFVGLDTHGNMICPQTNQKAHRRPTEGPRGPLVGFAAWAFVGFDEKAHRQGGKKKTRRGGRPPTPAPGLVPKKYVNFQIWILECGLILDLRSNSGPPAQTCPGLDSSTA